MKIEIDINDLNVVEAYEDYHREGTEDHREWGRGNWLYPGDIVAQIGGKSANTIMRAVAYEIRKKYEETDRK